MKLHPLCAIFPAIPKDELKKLADDIKVNGLIRPVITFEGQILEGQNRAAACKIAKVEMKTVEFGGDYEAAKSLVISENLLRRHLTTSQRSMIAAKLVKMEGKKKTVGQAAKDMKVSKRSVSAAKKVAQKSPELADKVQSGELTLHTASQVAALPKEEVENVAKSSAKDIKAKAKGIARKPRGGLAAPPEEPKKNFNPYVTVVPSGDEPKPQKKSSDLVLSVRDLFAKRAEVWAATSSDPSVKDLITDIRDEVIGVLS